MPRKIVLAVDGSEHAEKAWSFYYDNIRKSDDELILVYCAEPKLASFQRSVLQSAEPGAYNHETIQEILKESERESQGVEGKYHKILTEKEIIYRFTTRFGKPGEEIVKSAEDEQASIVVIGTRGLNKLRRTILGSVSSYVVNHVHCPILVVRD